MPQFFLNRKLITILIAIIIVVGLIGFTLRDRLNISWPEKFIKDTTGFVENVVDKPVSFVANIFSKISDLNNTYDENQKLKAQLENNIVMQTKIYELEKQVEELKKLTGIVNYRNESFDVTVIGRSADLWQESVTIDRGSNNMMLPNMAVLSAEGFLVGKVNKTSEFTSDVQLLTSSDNRNRISVEVKSEAGSSQIYGYIQGYDIKTKTLQLRGVQIGADLKVGQSVLSSGLGGVFPKGLPIGKVKSISLDEVGLSLVAQVEPYSNFNDLNYLKVVKRVEPAASFETEDKDEL